MSAALIRYFSRSDVQKCMSVKRAIELMKDAFVLLSNKKAAVPLRTHLDIPEYNGTELIKPVYIPEFKLIGFKVISLFKDNPAIGLPNSHALMMLFDATNGRALAIMDGDYLTAVRTGAASGLATDLLARKDSEICVIFGAGPQGEKQLEAVNIVRPLEKAYILDRKFENAQNFAQKMAEQLNISVEVGNNAEILKNADIICTATTSPKPLFSDVNLKPGVHINGVGSFMPDTREVPSDTVSRARVVVDQKSACLSEAGDIIIPINEGVFDENMIHAEIGEIVSEYKVGRRSDSEITFFKSVGNAVQDLVVAREILEIGQENNLGIKLEC
jgi:ornithine cyclodeaminase/alanine dehydrogenase-like protein (mu-crystallin family)